MSVKTPIQRRLIKRRLIKLGWRRLCLAGGGLTAALLAPTSPAAQWDCRASADGSRWICAQDGVPLDEPLPPLPERPLRVDEPPADVIVQPASPPPPSPVPTPVPPPAAVAAPAAAPSTPTTPPAATPAAAAPPPPQPPVPPPAPPPQPAAPPAPRAETAPTPPPAPPPKPPVEALPATPPPRQPSAPVSAPPVAEQPPPTPEPEPLRPEPTARVAAAPAAAALHEGLSWQCGRGTPVPAASPAGDEQPVDLEADSAETFLDDERAVLIGNAVVTQGEQTIRADRIDYDQTTGEVIADGQVLIAQPGSRVAGSSARYSTRTRQGSIEDARYRLSGVQDAHGTASRAELTGPGTTRFDDITYTTCRPGQSHWQLSASSLELDQNEGVGTAWGTVLRAGPVPIAYLPYIEFPIDDRRKSGFLPPAFGTSDNTGLDLTVPYYLNLAPNYDLTLIPRYTEKRGAVLGAEFRFLADAHEGEISGEYLPDDTERVPGGERGAINLVTRHSLTPRWRARSRIEHVSDDDYLIDLGKSLAVSSTTELERVIETAYYGDDWRLLGRVQDFQRLDGGSPAHDRLPEIVLDIAEQQGPGPIEWLARAEYGNFAHSSRVEGQRYDLLPTVRAPLRRAWGYLIPSAAVSYTAYELDDTAPGQDTGPDRTLPVLSLDGGLIFERDAQLFGRGTRQELEPRLFYLYVPHEDQTDLPVFDTDLRDLSFNNLFRVNRFTGPDRFGDANQLTAAVTHRSFARDTDEELMALSLGHIFYFEDQRVVLPGGMPDTDGESVYAGEARARLSRHLRLTASAQWDPQRDIDDPDQAELRLAYRVDNSRILNAAYRRRRADDIDETDLSAIWPLTDRVVALMRWNYSLEEQRNLEAFGGIEYRDCCWGVRALVRQHATSADEENLSFLLQFELRGLGRLGDKIEDTLSDSVYGYRIDED